ncbi:MAG: heme exporter protein CcmB [Parvularculaceae bacterium]
MRVVAAIVARDARLAIVGEAGAAQTLLYFALTVLVFAFAVGPEREALAAIAAPIVWAAALLAAMMSIDRLFAADAADGVLDMLAQRVDPLAALVLAKAAAHWLGAALPLLATAPLLALTLNLPAAGYGPLIASLALGSPALSLIAALVGALTFPIRRAGVLTTLLTAPLYAPTLVFGVDAAEAGAAGDPRALASLLFLAAVSVGALIVAPIAGAAALRFNLA